MLVSPAEPPQLRKLGIVSSVPEQYGADFLIFSPVYGTVGVQRKEIKDLIASLSDDRVAREVIQMKELDHAIWVLEGSPMWTSEGVLMGTHSSFSYTQFLGIKFSLLFQGFSVLQSSTLDQSALLLSVMEIWLKKDKHRGLNSRSQPRGMFGAADTTEWQIHFLQGLPGIGYERAKDIVEFYDGMPLQLKDGVKLSDVSGIGKVVEERIRKVFDGD